MLTPEKLQELRLLLARAEMTFCLGLSESDALEAFKSALDMDTVRALVEAEATLAGVPLPGDVEEALSRLDECAESGEFSGQIFDDIGTAMESLYIFRAQCAYLGLRVTDSDKRRVAAEVALDALKSQVEQQSISLRTLGNKLKKTRRKMNAQRRELARREASHG